MSSVFRSVAAPLKFEYDVEGVDDTLVVISMHRGRVMDGGKPDSPECNRERSTRC